MFGVALLFFVLPFIVNDMPQQIAIAFYTIACLLIVGGIISLTPAWKKLMISFARIKFCTKSKK